MSPSAAEPPEPLVLDTPRAFARAIRLRARAGSLTIAWMRRFGRTLKLALGLSTSLPSARVVVVAIVRQ